MGLWDKVKSILTPSSVRDEQTGLQEVQDLIGYRFQNESLLTISLTHRSYSHSTDSQALSNERLEFLGDSVLGLVIADQLYRDHPDMQEGELTQTKALLVNEATLAEIGKDMKLNEYMRLAPEEDRSGGRDRPSIISDTFESVIAAVFLDGGLEAVRDLILRLIYTRKEEISSDASRRNFKGELLELVQASGRGLPRYDIVSEQGPDHEKEFRVEVFIGGKKVGSGSGSTKKEAEQKAAAEALEQFENRSG